MRIGLLAYSTDTGLGNQTWEFFKHLHPAKTLVADLSRFNKMPTHHERFPGARIDTCGSRFYLSDESCEWLTDDIDILFVAETPLNYNLFQIAKRKGVPTVQQYNYEFLDYFRHPEWPRPTILAAPSTWHADKVDELGEVIYFPVPVNTDLIKPVPRREFKTFIHIIGRPTANDRNGTIQFLKAAMLLGNHYNYIVYLQPPEDERAVQHFAPVKQMIEEAGRVINLQVITNVDDYSEMYFQGDCLVLPRKYGGLCLPAQEALAAHIPVIMSDISPNNMALPKQWLVPATKEGTFFAHTDIDFYAVSPGELSNKMYEIAKRSTYGVDTQQAKLFAEKISWEKLKPYYLDNFQRIISENK